MDHTAAPEGKEMAKEDQKKTRNQARDDEGIKVTDRRLFTLNGELREAIEETDEENTAAEPQAETPASKPLDVPGTDQAGPETEAGFERRPLEEPEGVDFTMLINAMAQPALIFLGELAHPGSGEQEVNLEQARLQIDLLDMLRIKCRGNLTTEEEGLLDRILYQLRMLYVTRSNEPAK
jgi:hypothetical protein